MSASLSRSSISINVYSRLAVCGAQQITSCGFAWARTGRPVTSCSRSKVADQGLLRRSKVNFFWAGWGGFLSCAETTLHGARQHKARTAITTWLAPQPWCEQAFIGVLPKSQEGGDANQRRHFRRSRSAISLARVSARVLANAA